MILALTIGLGGAIASDFRIKDHNRLIEFSKSVNSGTNYKGTTVFLDADIDVPDDPLIQFSPIGNNSKTYFRGTFEGQGHVISNLRYKGPIPYVGLFGYSGYGVTVRNVIIDKSCTFESTYEDGNSYVGGIIGRCDAVNQGCTIENSVSMGDVTFSGSANNYNLYLGGISGYLQSGTKGYTASVENCDSYGTVTHSGTTTTSYIGGVLGYITSSNTLKYVKNCVNHGSIKHTGTTSGNMFMGGIGGRFNSSSTSYATDVRGCANYGDIQKVGGGSCSHSYIGGIVGHFYKPGNGDSYIRNCFSHGKITYKSSSDSLNIGGIAGQFEPSTSGNYAGDIKSCGNYGDIYKSENINSGTHIGGVVGYFAQNRYKYIRNCFNY